MLLEACIDSVADAIAAKRVGAGRVELCANLGEGGTTPSVGLIHTITAKVSIPAVVMIRPRGGGFVYSSDEMEVMLRDIDAAQRAGTQGIVSGVLHPDGRVNAADTRALLQAAAPLPFIFHRAFDQVRDLDEALDTCLACGVARILTSGGCVTAFEGMNALRRLCRLAGNRVQIMAGGGIRANHIREIIEQTGVREIHLGPRRVVQSKMQTLAGVSSISPSATIAGSWNELDEDALAAAVLAAASR